MRETKAERGNNKLITGGNDGLRLDVSQGSVLSLEIFQAAGSFMTHNEVAKQAVCSRKRPVQIFGLVLKQDPVFYKIR